jgi:glucose-1-phosphate thymidylyltransferase
LAGGTGSRLGPLTTGVSKHLLPVHDKPMIYYSFSTLLMAGVREIGLVHNARDKPALEALLGDGSAFGVSITYIEQSEPRGLAHGLLISQGFLGGNSFVLVLGDNIFYGAGLGTALRDVVFSHTHGARIFVKRVDDPSAYGVATMRHGKLLHVVEKPDKSASNLAVTGLYVFDAESSSIVSELSPSARGELEIVDLINSYADKGAASVTNLGRGLSWLDAGTVEGIHASTELIAIIQQREGLMIGSPEEIAFSLGWIDGDDLTVRAKQFAGSHYGDYLLKLSSESGGRGNVE